MSRVLSLGGRQPATTTFSDGQEDLNCGILEQWKQTRACTVLPRCNRKAYGQKEKHMGIIIKKKVYELADEGLHNVVLSRIEDLGAVETKNGTKQKAAIYFTCLDQKAKDGSDVDIRHLVNQVITDKSTLGKMLNALKIKSGEDFDMDDLIGLKCQIVVIHNEADNGNTYANISSFIPVKRAVETV